MPTEELFVNSWTWVTKEWDTWGSEPWLHDSNDDYIGTGIPNEIMKRFGFANSTGSGTINSVKLRVEHHSSSGSTDCLYYISGTYAGTLTETVDAWSWDELDVSDILDTWDKIDAATLYVKRGTNGAWYGLRRAKLVIDYSPSCSSYDNKTDCEAAGCCWTGTECIDGPCNCSDYTTKEQCEANDCYWWGGECHDEPEPSAGQMDGFVCIE